MIVKDFSQKDHAKSLRNIKAQDGLKETPSTTHARSSKPSVNPFAQSSRNDAVTMDFSKISTSPTASKKYDVTNMNYSEWNNMLNDLVRNGDLSSDDSSFFSRGKVWMPPIKGGHRELTFTSEQCRELDKIEARLLDHPDYPMIFSQIREMYANSLETDDPMSFDTLRSLAACHKSDNYLEYMDCVYKYLLDGSDNVEVKNAAQRVIDRLRSIESANTQEKLPNDVK